MDSIIVRDKPIFSAIATENVETSTEWPRV
jgi:hypothetical protein